MSMSFLYWGTQKWAQYSRCDLSGAEGKDHFSAPAGSAFPNAAQEDVDLHCCKTIFLARVQLLVHQDPLILSCPAAFRLVGP